MEEEIEVVESESLESQQEETSTQEESEDLSGVDPRLVQRLEMGRKQNAQEEAESESDDEDTQEQEFDDEDDSDLEEPEQTEEESEVEDESESVPDQSDEVDPIEALRSTTPQAEMEFADDDDPLAEQIIDANINADADALAQSLDRHRETTVNETLSLVEQRLERDRVAQAFGQQFPSIVENHRLYAMANQEIISLQEQGYGLHESAIAVGNSFNNWLDSIKGGSNQPTEGKEAQDPQTEKRIERKKKTVVNMPTASQKAEQPKKEKPATQTDHIKLMRQQRGLAV